jgi:hypothetical protein
MVVDAWDALPFAGGQRFGTITIGRAPYREAISRISAEQVVAEGFANMTPEQFIADKWIAELGGSRDDRPWVVAFKLRSLVILAMMRGGEGRRYEAFFDGPAHEALAGGLPFGVDIAGRRQQVYVDEVEYIGGNPFYTLESFE